MGAERVDLLLIVTFYERLLPELFVDHLDNLENTREQEAEDLDVPFSSASCMIV